MKLVSIQIFPLGIHGWSTEPLFFGDHITQIFGPNGSGKSPVIQSIPFCLGFSCIFRQDIYERCDYALLNILTDKGMLTIKRKYSREVEIEVITGKISRYFYDEKSFSENIFSEFNLGYPDLVSKKDQKTEAYMSTFLPIFYLDQDLGYASVYAPPANFIKDQFSEMMRIAFNIPAKNSFDSSKKRIDANNKLNHLDEQVERSSRRINEFKDSISDQSAEHIALEINKFTTEFELLKDSGSSHDESIGALDRLISKHSSSCRIIDSEIEELKSRSNSIYKISMEINTEIETLNLNEEAKRVFLSFDEICKTQGCHLFSDSSESYSKNLLYLKDQIKDLQRNKSIYEDRISKLSEKRLSTEEIVNEMIEERNSILGKSDVSVLIGAISEIKNHLFKLQTELIARENFEKLENSHFQLLRDRNNALSEYEGLTIERDSIPELLRLKSDLKVNFIKWLDTLHTPNISRDISFKDDFVPILGKEKLTALKGSTRARAILAYHASQIELISKQSNFEFRFLILDTPRQHEMHVSDLDNYMQLLKKLAKSNNVQIIFSSTDYRYSGNEEDIDWEPAYPGEEQLMFLKDKRYSN